MSPRPDISPMRSAPRRFRLLRRFRRNEDGVTAIEFGAVAMPFFGLLFAILEGALVFWSTQLLETAVADAARQLYTGQFQQAEDAKGTAPENLLENFRQVVCSRAKVMLPCSKIKIDVQKFTSFPNGVPSPIVTDGDGNRVLDPNFGKTFQKPEPNEIVVLRAAVEVPVIASILDANKSNLSGGSRLLMASAAFRTEPFK